MPTEQSSVRLYKRGRIYWTWYFVNGKPVYVSTKQTTRRAAEAEARRIEERVVGGSRGKDSSCTVAEAIDALASAGTGWGDKTKESHKSRAKNINKYLGSMFLSLLSEDTIKRYVAARAASITKRKTRTSEHAIHKELNLLRQACRLMGKELRFKHSPEYRARERFLSKEEAPLLKDHLDNPKKWWLTVALSTGARLGELRRLDWSDIDLVAGHIRVRGTKTEGADRTIPASKDLLRQLRIRGRGKCSGPVVVRWHNVQRDLALACKDAGIPRASPNDLRRTTASWMAQADVPPLKIAKWLGHNSLDMVMKVYARVNPESLKAAADTLPRL